MKELLVLIGLYSAVISCSSGQANDKIMILMVEDDRQTLAKALKLLDSSSPKLVCLNTYLECNHDDTDGELLNELNNINSLLMPSKLLPFGTGNHGDIIGCSTIYPKGATAGFINLIFNEQVTIVEKVQLTHSTGARVRYHFAMNIALSLDRDKTQQFMQSHSDTIAIDFSRERTFATFHFNDFAEGRTDSDLFRGKIVIVTIFPFDHFPIRKSKVNPEVINMSTAEIYANIACQLIGE
jgi:CHASE2 domain-containing sensor protein